MKGFSFFLIYILTEFNASIPFWNIENSSKNLFYDNSAVELITYYKEINNTNIKLIKEIRKNENNITEQNYFQINGNNKINTSWEDIDSFYYVKERIFICPRGKYFLSEYFLDNQTLKEIKPDNFSRNETWDLKCHYNSWKDYIALSFLKFRERIFYFFDLSKNDWVEEKYSVFSGFFDYKWIEDLDFQRIYAVFLDGDKFALRGIFFNIFGFTIIDFPIGNLSNYFYSCFDNSNIYWISFNNSNDCKIGYSYNIFSPTNREVNLIECPFKFLEDITINKINFIKNTRYIYYEIKNNINNEFYHGLYDIILNETLFNTKEDIIKFKPLTNNSMIAITNKSAYEICGIYKGDKCIEKCNDNEKLFINNRGKNYCKLNVNCTNYISLPENKCVDFCNPFYFINESESEKICGYCSDFFPNRQYKILHKNECIETIPENSYFFDKNLKIIDYCNSFCLKNVLTEIVVTVVKRVMI